MANDNMDTEPQIVGRGVKNKGNGENKGPSKKVASIALEKYIDWLDDKNEKKSKEETSLDFYMMLTRDKIRRKGSRVNTDIMKEMEDKFDQITNLIKILDFLIYDYLFIIYCFFLLFIVHCLLFICFFSLIIFCYYI